ncbi:DUF5995 family protein [Paractinoplanes toevensis]|uniref:Uncharacterized protein n=1 Tax=Paractinoplanes toevensis TaxID=571911 RepID=A0A919T762_9ACTN|nr:DUF5995 family protein [Actinoplanes toevensis]GIM90255.1 hypothetical protein Ato02nite_020480 [Actinoplanes toevensis]
MTMPFDRHLVRSAAESLRQARLRVSPARDPRGCGWDPPREPMAEALAAPAVSVGAVIAKLSAVGPVLDQAGADRVAAFNQLYLAISRRVQSALQTVATEPVYLELLAVELAKRYFTALDGWNRDDEDTPAVWAVLFGQSRDSGPSRLTAALIGVNAQLNHDLPLALLGVWRELGPPTGDQVHPDYRLLDQIYYDEIAPLRRGFSAEWERDLGELIGPLDDWTGRAVGTAVRAHSWAQAGRLWPLRDDPADFGQARHAMDEAAALIAEWAIVGDRLGTGDDLPA